MLFIELTRVHSFIIQSDMISPKDYACGLWFEMENKPCTGAHPPSKNGLEVPKRYLFHFSMQQELLLGNMGAKVTGMQEFDTALLWGLCI